MNQSVESAPPVDDIIEIIPMDEYDSNKVPLIDLLYEWLLIYTISACLSMQNIEQFLLKFCWQNRLLSLSRIQICHFQLPNILTFKTMLHNKHELTREWMLSISCLIYNGVAELDLWLMILKFKIHFNNFHCRRMLKFEFYFNQGKDTNEQSNCRSKR